MNPTIEGVIENGQIRLLDNVQLPENTRVYIVVAEDAALQPVHMRSPRLANPEQVDDFLKQVSKVSTDD